MGTVYYRFIVHDGPKTVYYEDDSDVRDGGWGKPFDSSPDWGWALTVYDPNFKPIDWLKNAVIYQIFPDRFRNANTKNDPARGNPKKYVWSKDKRYAYPHGDPSHESTPALDRIMRMPWGSMPEGWCRNYTDALQSCKKRFGPDKPVGTEGPHGRDYFGGDLAGITQKMAYLKSLGVTVVYMNPIFWAGSNHRYDTRDYTKIDPYLGKQADFVKMVKAAHKNGIKVLLDGVFNHMSSDSPMFDRYHNWPGKGACEQTFSKYRGFFFFRAPAGGEPSPCAPHDPAKDSYYESWAGFDSLPKLTEVFGVKQYVYDTPQSAAQKWLKLGADGWRLDVMQDKSIDFWHGFKAAVDKTKANTPIVGELWKKFDVLPYVYGDTATSSMDYRFRDAVISLLAPHAFDSKGFPGSGNPIPPSQFVSRMESIREDYPDAVYWTLMNLVDSHDTERILWTLTPGDENGAQREHNAANLDEGKARMKLAALIQMTMPGAPTIYYGDEVGVTGDDDPDDRRTYPWGDANTKKLGDTRKPDTAMRTYYKSLTKMRKDNAVLRDGQLKFLLSDDATGVLAYARKSGDHAAVVVVNSSKETRAVHVPYDGFLRGGGVALTVGPLSWSVQFINGDLTGPDPASGLTATATGVAIDVHWSAVTGAAGYNVYRSPLSGGGYTKVNDTPVTATDYHDASSDLRSGTTYYYIVKALDSAGNESAPSNEASAVPSYPISAVSLDRPMTLDYTISAAGRTAPVYGRIKIDGVTSQAGEIPGILAQVCYGSAQSPICEPMTFSSDAGDLDEYTGTLKPETPGTYSYWVRFSTSQGASWTSSPEQGTLTVHANPDQTPPRPTDRPDREEPRRDLDRPLVDGACRRRSVRLRRLSLDHLRVGLHRGRSHRRGDGQVHRHGPHLRRDLLLRRQGARPGEQPVLGVRRGERRPVGARGRRDPRRHAAGVHARECVRLHRRQPARALHLVQPAHDEADQGRRRQVAHHHHLAGRDVGRVQVHARRLGSRREGRLMRRAREPQVHRPAERRRRDDDRRGDRQELAERAALRRLALSRSRDPDVQRAGRGDERPGHDRDERGHAQSREDGDEEERRPDREGGEAEGGREARSQEPKPREVRRQHEILAADARAVGLPAPEDDRCAIPAPVRRLDRQALFDHAPRLQAGGELAFAPCLARPADVQERR